MQREQLQLSDKQLRIMVSGLIGDDKGIDEKRADKVFGYAHAEDWFVLHGHQFHQQLAHLLAAFQDYRVTVLQCDRQIQQIEEFTPDSASNHHIPWGEVATINT